MSFRARAATESGMDRSIRHPESAYAASYMTELGLTVHRREVHSFEELLLGPDGFASPRRSTSNRWVRGIAFATAPAVKDAHPTSQRRRTAPEILAIIVETGQRT